MLEDELYHHGRLGQSWGVRNGPPYPLSRSTVSEAYGKKRGIGGLVESRKQKKAEKAEREEQERKKRLAEDKERVLREGTATELLPYLSELSSQELSDAIKRIKWTNEINELSLKELNKGWDSVNSVMKKVGNVKDWTKIGLEFYKTIDEIVKEVDKKKQERRQ